MTVFCAARHNDLVWLCACFEPPDLLTGHKLARQVKSQVNDIHLQVQSRVIDLNSKSRRKSGKWANCVRLESAVIRMNKPAEMSCYAIPTFK